jgi:hypothetical protein
MIVKRRRGLSGLLCWVCCVSFVTTVASQEAGGQREMAEELAGIRVSLDRLVTLMETHVRHQRVDLLIRRITLRERRIDPLQGRLREAEQTQRAREEGLERLRAMILGEEAALDEAVRTGHAERETEVRRLLEELDGVTRVEQPLVDAGLLRVRQLEDQIAEEREEIQILDELLLEELE